MTLVRIDWVNKPITGNANATAGSTICERLPLPFDGKKPSFKLNIYNSKNPNQNVGIDTLIIDKIPISLSTIEFLYSAQITPRGILQQIIKAKATNANSIVAGSFAKISCPTGNLLTKDVPKSNCSTPFSQIKYWMSNGLSVPSSSRSACIASGVGAIRDSLRITSAGSTGTNRTKIKVIRDTPTNTNGRVIMRFRQKSHVDSYNFFTSPTVLLQKEPSHMRWLLSARQP